MVYVDRKRRSLFKAVTYRIISIMLDSVIAFAVTQSASKTILLVLVSNAISILVYFAHERAWNRIHWGKHINE